MYVVYAAPDVSGDGVGALCDTASSAIRNASGNVFPRLAARRRMPRQACALK
jgi:hypothetical protein